VAVGLGAILLAACGGGGSKNALKPTATTSDKSATTTSLAPGPAGTVKATGAVDPGGYGWNANAATYRGLSGKQLEFGCPPGGQLGSIYGTDTYTDDSSVCTAAVHAGKMTPIEGGQVVIAVQPGQPSYKASAANGVTSSDYDKYEGSFVVVSSSAFRGTTEPQTGGFGWKATPEGLRELVGQHFKFACPPAGENGAVYGTGTYTDDSSVCTAAIHAGKITKAAGGTVVIEITGPHSSFKASEANGVSSADWPDYPGSFTFVG